MGLNMGFKAFLLGVTALATVAVGSAQAGTITENFSFSLSGFTDINGSPPLASPVSQISGSFTAVFDPTLNYNNDTADLVVHSFTGFTPASTLGFTYQASSKDFFLGGIQNNSDFVIVGTTDFVLTLDLSDPSNPKFVLCNAAGISCGAHTGDPTFGASGFTTAGTNSLWFISAPQSSVGSTPLPAALPLFAGGLGVMGLFARRRKKSAAAVAA